MVIATFIVEHHPLARIHCRFNTGATLPSQQYVHAAGIDEADIQAHRLPTRIVAGDGVRKSGQNHIRRRQRQ